MNKKVILIVAGVSLCLTVGLAFVSNVFRPKTNSIYSITYMVDNKEYRVEANVENGTIIDEPEAPKKDGYKFIGWYVNDTKFDFSKPITQEIKLEAKWEKIESNNNDTVVKTYTITFDSNGGSKVDSQTVEENKTVTKPSNPTKSGYTFVNWYYDDSVFDFDTKITKNITLVAQWKKNESTNNNVDTSVTTEKNVTVTEKISFKTEEIKEKNMERGKTQIVQNGVEGQKTITYKVTYNYKGQEISRKKISESVTKQPTNKIVKVGISDYNLNTDTIGYSGSGVYCLDEDLIDLGADYPACVGTTQGYFKMIYLKTGNYLYSYSVGETSYDDAVYQNIKPLVKLTNVYKTFYKGNLNGTTYNFQFLVGSGYGPQLNLLTEAECTKFGLACGRW